MKSDIKLSYGRVGELYDGSIWVQVYPTRGFLSRFEFEGYSFPRMMSKLAEFIREYEETTVVLTRTEANGSHYRLDAETVDLLRTDPAAAISHMMPESRLVVIRNEMKTTSQPPSGLLRAGHETIAASFGDELYCEVNQAGKIECPGCGRWTPVTSKWLSCTSPRCAVRVRGIMTGKSWFVVSTETMLSLKLSRYYFPRNWNPKKGWISWDELNEMYETFKKERELCFQENVPKV